VWSALGGELKPSIDVVVSAPINTGQRMEVGPPVTEPPLFHFGGSAGLGGPEELSFAVDNTGPEGAGKPAQSIRGPNPSPRDPSPRADQGTEAGDPRRVSMRRRRLSIKKPS
jgi:hypothetical protein